jgi:hypothetical protein
MDPTTTARAPTMNKLLAGACLALALLASTAAGAKSMSDADVRRAMIQESISSYPGHCPCPYNLASNGSHCGKRSAWSKPGGYAPLCYPNDISDDMVKQYRASHGISGGSQ